MRTFFAQKNLPFLAGMLTFFMVPLFGLAIDLIWRDSPIFFEILQVSIIGSWIVIALLMSVFRWQKSSGGVVGLAKVIAVSAIITAPAIILVFGVIGGIPELSLKELFPRTTPWGIGYGIIFWAVLFTLERRLPIRDDP